MNRYTTVFILLVFLAGSVFGSAEGVLETEAGNANAAAAGDELPVTAVTLYSAGLAQIVHETTVTGSRVIDFQVDPGDINDILKSLVVEDLDGGNVNVVNFDASDPLSVVLGDLRVNPSGSPSLFAFLRQTQGETVTVITAAGEFSGRIFSIEEKPRPAPSEGGTYTALNLMDKNGIRSIDISILYSLRFEDSSLQQELSSALEKIAGSRVKSVRTLKISLKGSGERRIRLSYIRTVPLWKTSYRIIIDENGVPRLEGWAIVQNTGNAAWNDVKLSFTAGSPNAFTMDLSTPRYIIRQSAEISAGTPIGTTAYEKAYKSAPSAAPSMSRSYDAPAAAMDEGFYDFEEAEAYAPPPTVSQADGVRSGNFYRYEVRQPVTVGARSSAMIPIIQKDKAGTPLGVYDPSYGLVFKGIRLKNSTEAHWAAGPATVLEGRFYGGDALLPEMIPGSERLITYAVHGTVDVSKEVTSEPRRMTSVKISGGILYRTDKMDRVTSYFIDGDEDELLLIHPKESGWVLSDSPETYEETPGEYRFSLTDWKSPVKVAEEYLISSQYRLVSLQISDLSYYLEWDGVSGRMKTVLNRLSELKRNSEAVRAEINSLNEQINLIGRDQSRIRENMKVLDKESELFTRYSDQLSQQEDKLASLNRDITDARLRLQKAETETNNYIAGIEI